MRILLLLMLWLLMHKASNAQSISVKVVGSSYSNILYVGGNNLIEIKNLPVGAKVRMTRGNVAPLGSGQFYITEKYCSFPKYDTMIIYKGADIFEKKAFRFVYNGAPVVAINGITCLDSIKASDLFESRAIKIIPDSLHYKVTHFEMSVLPLRGETIGPMVSESERFTMKQMEVIQSRTIRGDKYYLDNIKATCTPCGLPPIRIESIQLIITKGLGPWCRF